MMARDGGGGNGAGASGRLPRHIAVAGAHAPLEAALWRQAGGEKNDTLMVFLHGGNFIADGSGELVEFFDKLHAHLPALLILAPRYTLATASPFPTPLDDVYSVLEWARKHKTQLGWSGKTLVIGGIEAGATLAAAVALVSRDRHGPRLDGQILLMPMLDPGQGSRSMRESEAQADDGSAAARCASGYRCYLPHLSDRIHPYAAPLHSSRLKDLPATLIFSVDRDPLRDEAEAYGVKLIAQGVRTSVVRLPAVLPDVQAARTECAASAKVIAEMAAFLQTLP